MGLFTKLFERRAQEIASPRAPADPEVPSPVEAAPPPPPPTPPPEPPSAAPEAASPPVGSDPTPEPEEPAEAVQQADPEAEHEDPLEAAFGDFVEDFFDSAVGSEDEPGFGGDEDEEGAPQLAMEGESAAELRATFAGVAARHLLPVRQLHARLREGPVSVDWIGLCRPAVSTVGRTAVEMDLIQLVRPLDQLAALLSSADREGGQEIDGASRDHILQACDELVALFPEAFVDHEDDPDARESLTVHAVLRQVPQIGTVSLDKIFAAGLTAMQMLAQASAEDLSVTTGIAEPLADRVRDAVDHFLDETASLREGGSPVELLELLGAAVTELERQHLAYGDTPDTEEGFELRKGYRRARRLAQLRAHTYLATLGEAPLVEEMQRLPLDRALERVHSYLSSFKLSGPDTRPDSAAADLPQE
jgi:hypothetical protein